MNTNNCTSHTQRAVTSAPVDLSLGRSLLWCFVLLFFFPPGAASLIVAVLQLVQQVAAFRSQSCYNLT